MLVPALAFGFAVQLDDLHGHLLALAERDEVDEVRHRLAVVHCRTARDDERREVRAVGGANGQPRKIKHVQNGGERHLVADGKGNDVKLPDGVKGFQRVERDIRPAHLLLHVAPWGEAALAPHAGHVVHHAVENAHAEVGHADLVGIGKTERNAGIDPCLVLHHGVIFTADIARRFLHARQNAFKLFIHRNSPYAKKYQEKRQNRLSRVFYTFTAFFASLSCGRAPQSSEHAASRKNMPLPETKLK